jgi:catalase
MADRKDLTTRQGHPVYDNQNQRTIGNRGPATLENYHFLEKISHFDRERIPERVVHARGCVVHGFFEAYGTIGDQPSRQYTRAKLFAEKGKRTPVTVRFSTVIGGRDSSEAARDPRGFAVKFRTEDGNWDLVGNNLPVFFIRDAIKFPDVIHALKPDPTTFRQEANRIFDFMANSPESMHMLTHLFSPRGIPTDYRHQQGFGVNTYKFVNAEGDTLLVKFHWHPKQGVAALSNDEAERVQGQDLGHASKDLYEAIERGDFPEWEMLVQIMSDDEHPELDWDPLDDTKAWPEDIFPLLPVGRMVLDRNVSDHHNENEQAAFGTGVLVDGLDFSDDKMLIGRTFSYSDTQRYRVGPNYLQLPVNAPLTQPNTNQRGGQMSYHLDGHGNPHVNYEPNMHRGLTEAPKPGPIEQGPEYHSRLTRSAIERQNNYQQAADRFWTISTWERDELVDTLIGLLAQCERDVQERMVWHLLLADDEYGRRVGEGIGVSADDVRRLAPMPGQNLTEVDRRRLDALGHAGRRQQTGSQITGSVRVMRVADVPDSAAAALLGFGSRHGGGGAEDSAAPSRPMETVPAGNDRL